MYLPENCVSIIFVFILLLSDVQLMIQIQKTSQDPGIFGPDPDPVPYPDPDSDPGPVPVPDQDPDPVTVISSI